MLSHGRKGASAAKFLDAARDCVLEVGWRRTTLTDVARRAGVSRMTIYRRWPDTRTLLADVMHREWSELVTEMAPDGDGTARDRLADTVVGAVSTLRAHPLFRKIVDLDPELLLPYLLDRRGRSQDTLLLLLRRAISEGQRKGSVRPGNPGTLARAILLAAHGFALSVTTMADDVSVADLDSQLHNLVERYLRP